MPFIQEAAIPESPGGLTSSAEKVATVVASTATVGAASDALRSNGWQSTIAGNRITVDDRIFARFIGDGTGRARWVVYGIDEQPPVRVVDAAVPAVLAEHRPDEEIR